MKLAATRISQGSACFGMLFLTLVLSGCSDQAVIEGINADTGQPVGGEAAEVEDLGDGSSNEGGTPDLEADLYEAAITNEPNLGPNAPGYIP